MWKPLRPFNIQGGSKKPKMTLKRGSLGNKHPDFTTATPTLMILISQVQLDIQGTGSLLLLVSILGAETEWRAHMEEKIGRYLHTGVQNRGLVESDLRKEETL